MERLARSNSACRERACWRSPSAGDELQDLRQQNYRTRDAPGWRTATVPTNSVLPKTRLAYAHTMSLGSSYGQSIHNYRDLRGEAPYKFRPRVMVGDPEEELFTHKLKHLINTDYHPTECFWLKRREHAKRMQWHEALSPHIRRMTYMRNVTDLRILRSGTLAL